jgi:hypothetical protein
VEQISPSTPTDAPTAAPDESAPQEAGATAAPLGFGARGRTRRRARYLRKARELAYRDLGGLVFNLHRFGQRNDELVMAKLTTLAHIDGELRTLEATLGELLPVTVLREAGITACPRCAAIHSSEDHFCPNCGLPVARDAELPIAGPVAATAPDSGAGAAAAAVAPAPANHEPPRAPGGAPSGGAAQTPAPTPGSSGPQASAPPPATAAPAPARATPAAARANAAASAPVGPAAPAVQSQSSAGEAATAPGETPPDAEPASATKEEATEIIRPPAANQ